MTVPTPTRRRFLLHAGTAASLTGLAGCTDSGSEMEPPESRQSPESREPTKSGNSAPTDGATGGTSPATDDGRTTNTDTTSTSTTSTNTTTSTASEPRTVRFQSTAGTEVVGTLYGRGECGVVFVPQINLDRESWRPQAETVAGRGHAALAIDEDPEHRAASALGAVRYLRQRRGVERVVLVGASSGGEAVVRANARAEEGSIGGLVTLSAAGGAEVADQLQGRKLFVVSEGDDDRFVRTAKRLHERAPEPKALKIYSGSAHGQAIFETHGEDLSARLFGLVEEVCAG